MKGCIVYLRGCVMYLRGYVAYLCEHARGGMYTETGRCCFELLLLVKGVSVFSIINALLVGWVVLWCGDGDDGESIVSMTPTPFVNARLERLTPLSMSLSFSNEWVPDVINPCPVLSRGLPCVGLPMTTFCTSRTTVWLLCFTSRITTRVGVRDKSQSKATIH